MVNCIGGAVAPSWSQDENANRPFVPGGLSGENVSRPLGLLWPRGETSSLINLMFRFLFGILKTALCRWKSWMNQSVWWLILAAKRFAPCRLPATKAGDMISTGLIWYIGRGLGIVTTGALPVRTRQIRTFFFMIRTRCVGHYERFKWSRGRY